MILRILGEGQLKMSDEAVEKGDEGQFQTALTNLVNRVRELGQPVPDDYIGPSELILPASDATLEEVKELLSDEGLIPG